MTDLKSEAQNLYNVSNIGLVEAIAESAFLFWAARYLPGAGKTIARSFAVLEATGAVVLLAAKAGAAGLLAEVARNVSKDFQK